MQWDVAEGQLLCQETWLPSEHSLEDAPMSTDEGYFQSGVAEP